MDTDPITNKEHSRRVGYYGHHTRPAECICGWTGTGGQLERDHFDGGMSLDCPDCFAQVASIIWPDEAETRAAAALGDKEAIHAQWTFDNPDATIEERVARSMDYLEREHGYREDRHHDDPAGPHPHWRHRFLGRLLGRFLRRG